MTSANVLRILDVAPPCALDPAPPWTPCGTAHVARLAERHPCIRCGATATVAGVVTHVGTRLGRMLFVRRRGAGGRYRPA
ncbi:hypothetical protein K388_02780 [Streptomyces sp. KhCrAH-43]|nr:hypothetical protein K388_02780 [Streptomyces sp. KhCrAH-43]